VDSAAAAAGVPLGDRVDVFALPLGDGVDVGEGLVVTYGLGTLETPPADTPAGDTGVGFECVPPVAEVDVRVMVNVDVPSGTEEGGATPLLDPSPEFESMDIVQDFSSLNRPSPFAPVIGVITTVQLWVKTPASVGICWVVVKV